MRVLSTRELATALGVSESSLKRWVDLGKIAAFRTEGGHRRITVPDAIRFIRETRTPVVRPEVLDLPDTARSRSREDTPLTRYLIGGDSVGARGWLLARYLEGATVASLADGPIRDALVGLGELWHSDERGIFIEHRGTEVCLQALAQLRTVLPPPAPTAPTALGGAPSGDPYLIATQLSAMVTTEVGMRAVNLGPDTPVSGFASAVAEHQARLVWLCITAPLAPQLAESIATWLDSLPPTVIPVVGGPASRTLSRLPPHAIRGATMADLADAARAVVRAG